VRQLIEEKKVYILCSCAERLPVGDVRVVGLDALDLVPVKTLNTTYIYLLEDEKADQVLELKTGKEKMHSFMQKICRKILLDEPVVRRWNSLPLLWSCKVRLAET
jgi:hypothetical protein